MFQLDLQRFGGKGTSTTVTSQAAAPTAEETRLEKVQANYAEQTAPTALALQNVGSNMILNDPGITNVDYSAMNDAAQQGASNLSKQYSDLSNGILPSSYLQNETSYLNDAMQGTIGNTLSGLGNRGILNSSVTSGAMDSIGRNINATVAGNYNNNIKTQQSLLDSQYNNLSTPMTLANAAQNASIDIPSKILALSQGQQSDTSSLLNTLANRAANDKTTTQTTTGGNDWLTGLLSGAGSYFGAASCFVAGTKITTPSGDKNIEDIQLDDAVMNPDGEIETVIEIMTPCISPDKYLTVETETKKVTTTSTQEFCTLQGDLIAPALIGRKCITPDGTESVWAIYPAPTELVYDFKTTGSNTYYANGFLVRGRK